MCWLWTACLIATAFFPHGAFGFLQFLQASCRGLKLGVTPEKVRHAGTHEPLLPVDQPHIKPPGGDPAFKFFPRQTAHGSLQLSKQRVAGERIIQADARQPVQFLSSSRRSAAGAMLVSAIAAESIADALVNCPLASRLHACSRTLAAPALAQVINARPNGRYRKMFMVQPCLRSSF